MITWVTGIVFIALVIMGAILALLAAIKAAMLIVEIAMGHDHDW